MNKMEKWAVQSYLMKKASEEQKEMINLVVHYRDEKEILDPIAAGYYLFAIGLGINPFSDGTLLKYLVDGMKKMQVEIHYLSNKYLDRELYYRLFEDSTQRCEICGSLYKEICDNCLDKAIDEFMESEK